MTNERFQLKLLRLQARQAEAIERIADAETEILNITKTNQRWTDAILDMISAEEESAETNASLPPDAMDLFFKALKEHKS